MTGLKAAVAVMVLSGTGLVAQLTPLVPEDWKSWPATAILGFVTLASLAALVWTAKGMGKALMQTAGTLGKMSAQEEERNRRFDELAGKWGETNTQLRELNTNLRARPCIMSEKMLAKMMKRTQEISGE